MLRAVADGDREAEARLFDRLYDDLHARAVRLMRGQAKNHSLQATGLVHEAYLRLAARKGVSWADRTHFIAVAARAMRCALVDHARGKARLKRNTGAKQIPLHALSIAFEDRAIDLVAVDQAMKRLEERDPRAARIVELRFFGGLTAPEVAELLDVSTRTVERDWEVARAWLRRELS